MSINIINRIYLSSYLSVRNTYVNTLISKHAWKSFVCVPNINWNVSCWLARAAAIAVAIGSPPTALRLSASRYDATRVDRSYIVDTCGSLGHTVQEILLQ